MTQSTPSFLERLRHRSSHLNKLLNHEWGLLTGAAIGLFLFLILFSYDPRDAGFFSSGSGQGHLYNWGDATGAWVSSFLLYLFGVFAYVMPFGVGLVSWVVFRIRLQDEQVNRGQLFKSVGSLFGLLLAGAGLATLYLDASTWFVPLPYSGGGMLGYAFSHALVVMIDRLAATLTLMLMFAVSLSWLLSVSWLHIVDLTGELIWLMADVLKTNWQRHWLPAFLAIGDWLAHSYQAWRRGERVLPTQAEVKGWSAQHWYAVKAFIRASVSNQKDENYRPVGEPYQQAIDVQHSLGQSTPNQSVPGKVNPMPFVAVAPVPSSMADRQIPVVQNVAAPQPHAAVDRSQANRENEFVGVAAESADHAVEDAYDVGQKPLDFTQAQQSIDADAVPSAPLPFVPYEPAQYKAPVVTAAQLPSLTLLDEVPPRKQQLDNQTLQNMALLLEQSLKEYNIRAEVVGIVSGPVVTMFELQPAPGVKVGSITNLAKDLARSMSVMAVRVVDIIPGKSVIGIEIPNPIQESISFRDVLASDEYQHTKMTLPIVLGKDTSGRPTVADLAKMPHALVAGQTGSGKSVGVNAMIVSLLYHARADEVKFIMIDPKMLELSVYEGIPHLLAPVVTDMSEAANALRWCVVEMERRYQLMSKLGVRNIAGYNEKIQAAIDAGKPIYDPLFTMPATGTFEMAPDVPTLTTLPYIVVIVDEFADLFMVVGKKVEELIARLAQKARAAGIHIILATQRPSVDVVTGLIKANIPARISFKVASKIDSRTILDQMGADQLLGRGDMLYLGNGMGVPQRVHGPFVSDDEVHRVVEFLKTQGEPDYVTLDPAAAMDASGVSGGGTLTSLFEDEPGGAEKDALYDEAVAFVVESRRVSVSSVQRRFKIGYNRAARIVEAMEAAGLVSAQQPNGNREVLFPQ